MDASTLTIAAFGTATLLVMFAGHRAIRWALTPKKEGKVDLAGENRAYTLRETGDVLAIFLVGAGVVKNCVHGEDLVTDIKWVAAFAALGLVLLELTGHFGLLLLFNRRLNMALDRGNVAAGAAAAAHYVATGLITSRAVAGTDLRGVWLSLVFFVLAQAVHQLLVALFRLLTTYDDAEQIEGENLAAAISYAGVSLAVALIVARACEGDFVGWKEALTGFGALCATALGLYPLRQLVVQSLIFGTAPSLRGGALDVAVGKDRNVAVAAVEAASFVGMALTITMLA